MTTKKKPYPNQKVSEDQRLEICERWRAGETTEELGQAYGVNKRTIGRILQRQGVTTPSSKKTIDAEVRGFAKRVRSILWRGDQSRKKYGEWNDKVTRLEANGMNRKDAIVHASKDYIELRKLFQEFNVEDHDPHEESHPGIKHQGKPAARKGIPYTGEKLTQLDSLRWAAVSAGNYLNTGLPPEAAPNAECFFYYRMALDEPRDFMSRIVQLFSRYDEASVEDKKNRARIELDVADIESSLDILGEDDGHEHD